MGIPVKFSTKASVTEFLLGFQQLRLKADMTDLTIVTMGGQECSAHRLVLKAKFPRIRSVLPKHPGDELLLTRFPLKAVEAAIDFAYTGELEIDEEYDLQLYLLSHNLGSTDIRDFSREYIVARLTGANVCDVWAVAGSVRDEVLMRKCLPALQDEFENVALNSRFLEYTDITGLFLVCQTADSGVDTSTETPKMSFISRWVDERDSPALRQSNRASFERLVEEADLSNLTFEQFLSLQHLATELGVSRSCRNLLVAEVRAARTGPSEPFESSSSNCETKDEVAATSQHNREMIFALVPRDNKYFVTNVSALGNHSETYVELPIDRHTQVTTSQNWIVALGGEYNPKRFTIFDAMSKRVFGGPSMINGRSGDHTVAGNENFIFALGGATNEKNECLCEVYDKRTGRWSSLPNLPLKIVRASACAVPEGGVAIAGNYGYSCGKEAFLLQRGVDRQSWFWRRLPDMIQPRSRPGIAYFDNRIFVAGGNNDDCVDVECIPSSNGKQWTFISLISAPKSHVNSIFVLEKKLVFCCGNYVFQYSSTDYDEAGSSERSHWKDIGQLSSLFPIYLLELFCCYLPSNN